MTLLVRKTFCIYFFSLGFSVEFALFDSINKVDFVNIILYVKCPLWMECMSVFFSGVTEINFGQNKIRIIKNTRDYHSKFCSNIDENNR